MITRNLRYPIYIFLIFVFLFCGYLVGKSQSKITGYEAEELRVINNALNDYSQRKMNIDGVGGILVLGITPIKVDKEIDHCDMVSGNSFQDNPDLFHYRITAQKHTIYKIPFGKIYFRCGGNAYSKRNPR